MKNKNIGVPCKSNFPVPCTLHIKIKDMAHKRYGSMDLLLELLLVLLLLLLYDIVFHHVHTRVPSCNARKKMKLQEGAAYRKNWRGMFE